MPVVYWVRAGDTNQVKVGWADDVARRIKGLQIGCPEVLILLRVEDGGRTMEARLHQHYKDKHVRSEWFVLDATDVAVDLKTLPPVVELDVVDWIKPGSARAPNIISLFQPLIERVEKHCHDHSLTEKRFGYNAIGDYRCMRRVRNGEVSARTVARLGSYLDNFSKDRQSLNVQLTNASKNDA